MVRCIEFRRSHNVFQKQLPTDIKQTNKTEFVLVSADKTTNMYKVSVQDYNKLVTENITKTYKKSGKSDIRKINLEARSIAKELKLDSKIEQFENKKAYFILKDHNDNFLNSLKCRLINPAKSEIGITSKHYLEKINDNIRRKSKLQQWRHTSSLIAWFRQISSKEKSRFDIFDFYLSITEELLMKSVNHAKSIEAIDENILKVIMHSRKSLLFDLDNA